MKIIRGAAYLILFTAICVIASLALTVTAVSLGLNGYFFYGLIGVLWVSFKLGKITDWLFDRLWSRVMA